MLLSASLLFLGIQECIEDFKNGISYLISAFCLISFSPLCSLLIGFFSKVLSSTSFFLLIYLFILFLLHFSFHLFYSSALELLFGIFIISVSLLNFSLCLCSIYLSTLNCISVCFVVVVVVVCSCVCFYISLNFPTTTIFNSLSDKSQIFMYL